MSEKVDKRKIVSADRLEHMKKMREALALRNEQKKQAKLNPPKEPEPLPSGAPNHRLGPVPMPVIAEVEEEPFDEIEAPVPKKRVVSKQNVYSFEEDIRLYVNDCLQRENIKKRKWQARKEEIKQEILQSLQPTPPPVVSNAPVQNNKNAVLDLKDLFN